MRLETRPIIEHAEEFAVRRLLLEYFAFLRVDLCFQDFQQELVEFPAAYARLLMVGDHRMLVPCVDLRRLSSPGPGSFRPFLNHRP